MAVRAGEAVIAATRVTDTIKQVDASGTIRGTPDRSELWGAQTPQGFGVERLRQAHRRARAEGWTATEDAALPLGVRARLDGQRGLLQILG